MFHTSGAKKKDLKRQKVHILYLACFALALKDILALGEIHL